MSRLGQVRLTTALILTLFNGYLFAQTSIEVQGSASADQTAEPTSVNVEDSTQPRQSARADDRQEPRLVAALNSSGLIRMENAMKRHVTLGAAVTGGWDSNPSDTATSVSSGVYSLSPYLGIQAATPKTQYILQYQPTITGYSAGVYGRQTIHTASAFMAGDLSERWKWDLTAFGSYGQNAARFLAPQQSVAVGVVPGTGSNAASFLPNAGTVTNIIGTVGFQYRKSERDTLGVSASNSFNRYTGFNENSSIATIELGYKRSLSATLGLITYIQGLHYYGAFSCDSFGGGVGIQWQIRDRTFFSLNGGPQLNTPACGNQQGLAYNAAFSTRISTKSQLYVLSNSQPANSNLGPGLWERSASGGYQWQVASTGTLNCNAAYVSSDTLTVVSAYRGTYVGCAYQVKLRHGLTLSYEYRGYLTVSGETRTTRQTALFSLAWTNNGAQIFQ